MFVQPMASEPPWRYTSLERSRVSQTNTHKIIVLAAHCLGLALFTEGLLGTINAHEFIRLEEPLCDAGHADELQHRKDTAELRIFVVRLKQ